MFHLTDHQNVPAGQSGLIESPPLIEKMGGIKRLGDCLRVSLTKKDSLLMRSLIVERHIFLIKPPRYFMRKNTLAMIVREDPILEIQILKSNIF